MFKLETRAGKPIVAGKVKITPIAQVLRLQPPGLRGGLIWNRPVAVQVEKEDGSQGLIPIRDMTRLVQIALVGFTAAGMAVFWLLFKIVRRKR